MLESIDAFIKAFVKEAPVIGCLLACTLTGIFAGITIGAFFLKPKNSILRIIKVLFIVISLFINYFTVSRAIASIIVVIASVKGIGFLVGLVGAALLVILSFVIVRAFYKTDLAKRMERIRTTSVFKAVLKKAKEVNPTAIYCCYDGVRIIYNQSPHPSARSTGYSSIQCKTMQEYERAAKPRITSYSAISVHNKDCVIDFPFVSYRFANMEQTQTTLFLKTICQELVSWKADLYVKFVSFKEPDHVAASGLTPNAYGGYNVSYDTSKGKSHQCVLDWYSIALPVTEPAKMNSTQVPEEKLEQW